MNFDKKNINALIYLGVFVVLIVVLYFSYKTYIRYKASSTFYNSITDNINETLLIDKWTHGENATISPLETMPQSMIANEYSISFLIYINDIQHTNRNTEQIIFIKGTPGNSELKLSIKPLQNNRTSNLRFTCKLQIDVAKTDLNDILGDDAGEQFSNTSVSTGSGEQFSNTSISTDIGSNSNRIHDKIGSNIVEYSTIQNIYSNETFESISKETFADTTDGVRDTDILKANIHTKMNTFNDFKLKSGDLLIEITKLLNSYGNTHKEDAAELTTVVGDLVLELPTIKEDSTREELDVISANIDKKIEEVENLFNQIKKMNDDISGSTKNEDYIDVSNTSTQKTFQICLIMHDNVMDIYKNGMLESSKVLDTFPLIEMSKFTFFPDVINNGFNGSIHKFKYFNRALTHEDVVKNYNADKNTINNTTVSDLQT
jgi:hypothetical protein